MAKQRQMGRGCLVLFSLPFAAVGVGCACWLIWTFWQVIQAQSWIETPAKILDVQINGGDTSRTEARYSYRFAGPSDQSVEGREYEGARVSFYPGSDNIGSFQRDAYDELSSHQQSGKPFRCFVNPQKPDDSVLYRCVRWPMFFFQLTFALVFGGVGFGLVFGVRIAARFGKKSEQLVTQFPDEPWKWREDWASGVIRADRSAAKFLLIFAAFWNLISFPLGIVFVREALKEKHTILLLVLLFPLIGIILAISAVYVFARARRFRGATLKLATVPGVIGGKLAGIVRLTQKIRPDDGFHLRLKCTQTIVTGSGDDRSTREDVLWEDSKLIGTDASKDPRQTAIPVLFAIPYNQPHSDPKSVTPIAWKLEVRAKNPGIDLAVDFVVPVFQTAESSPDFKLDETPIKSFLAEIDPLDELHAERIRIEQTARGTAYVFPPARLPGQAIGITIFTLIWTGIEVGMIIARKHGNGPPLIFPIVFGAFDVLILLFFVDAWLGCGRIEVDHGTLRWRHGICGRGARGEIAASDISEFKAVYGSHSGNNVRYSIAVNDTAGRQQKISRYFSNKHSAETLIAELNRALGRS